MPENLNSIHPTVRRPSTGILDLLRQRERERARGDIEGDGWGVMLSEGWPKWMERTSVGLLVQSTRSGFRLWCGRRLIGF